VSFGVHATLTVAWRNVMWRNRSVEIYFAWPGSTTLVVAEICPSMPPPAFTVRLPSKRAAQVSAGRRCSIGLWSS
jgi:hypothetical protein